MANKRKMAVPMDRRSLLERKIDRMLGENSMFQKRVPVGRRSMAERRIK